MSDIYNSIPNYPFFYKYVLEVLESGEVMDRARIFDLVADATHLNQEQRRVVMKKGVLLYKDRIAWSLTYLKKAGLVFQPQRSYWQITDIGKGFIEKNRDIIIDDKSLIMFPEFKKFFYSKKEDNGKAKSSSNIELKTPDEIIENIIHSKIELVKSDLLEILKKRDPFLFEYTCRDLLLAMGYAGGIEEFATVTQKSNDGGVDCIIKQDPLGINNIYIQAKRYEGIVHEKEIRHFLGSLAVKQAQSGVFITTGNYSEKAINSARQANCNVVLINGDELVSLMIKYKIGVEKERNIEILKINDDYFDGV